MSDWEPVATRGCLDVEIWTAQRLLEDTGEQPRDPYLVIVLPDDGESFAMACRSLDLVATFVRDMAPRVIEAYTIGTDAGEDADELIQFCRRGVARH